jgi:hypothetical protein
MKKRAVVVGINDYYILDSTRKSDLQQAVWDGRAVYHLLKDAFGFGEIYHLEDRQASRERILHALRHVLAISAAGDVVCFYFSGHGARLRGDLAQADCDTYYEALVPASGAWITDRDLAQLADRLNPEHVNFTVITDACHSGGLHLADAHIKCRTPTYRGDLIEAIVSFMQTLIPCGLCLPLGSGELQHNVTNVRTGSEGAIDLDPDPDKRLVAASKATLLAACRFDELSWESSQARHGLFTQSMLETMSQSGFFDSYHDVIDLLRGGVAQKIARFIHPSRPGTQQTPQLFGQRNRMGERFLAGWVDTPARP